MTRYDTKEIKRVARLDDVVAKRGFKITREGKKLWISCPFHADDETPSLCLEPEKNSGVWRCHGCEKGGDVIRFVELLDSIDFVDAIKKLASEYGLAPQAEAAPTVRRKVAEWRYVEVDGSLVQIVERHEPGQRGRDKDFVQRLPDGKPGKNPHQVLYRLPEVVFAELVFVVEGEKCADAVAGVGLVSTTHAGGSSAAESTWTPAFAAPLRGKRVVLMPDNDDVGRKAMKHVARVLAPIAREALWLELPVKKKGEDVVDWLAAGGTKDKLLALVDAAKKIEPTPKDDGARDGLKFTDSSNAELFVKQYGERLRFSSAAGAWLAWDERRWVPDREGLALRFTKEVLRSMYVGLENLPSGDQVALVKHITNSGKAPRRQAMLTLAAAEPGVSVVPEQLDADPWVLTVENGTINLKTGELRAHRKADLCTKLAPVKYAEDAKAPAFMAFVEQILPDADVRCFVQRMLGYALTGVVADHVLPVFYGTGGNGKGTLMTTVQSVLGEYARQVPATLLMARKDEGHPTEKASLFGCRLAVASETRKNAPLAEDTVKHLTGGDVISARFMRQDFFDFAPTHKVVLQTNHKPRISGTDNGIWRRLRLVPFTVAVPEAEQDTALAEKLKREKPGVLRWLVDGCLQWQQHGLGREGAVAQATLEYRRDQDGFGAFLAACVVTDQDQVVRASDLYDAYKKWALREGEKYLMSARAFGLELTERRFERGTLHGYVTYRGIRLIPGDQGDLGGHRPVPDQMLSRANTKDQGHLPLQGHPVGEATDDDDEPSWGDDR